MLRGGAVRPVCGSTFSQAINRSAVLSRSLAQVRCVSSKARNAKYELPTDPKAIKLNSLSPPPGAITKKFIVGRGIGSGLGKTCGKGHKGQWARNAPPDWFEGGQTPLYRRVRKFGFKNPFSKPLASVNLDNLQAWYDRGLISAGETITMRTLVERNLVKSIKHGLKVLARGVSKFNAPVKLEVTAVSEQAKKAIEKTGGSVTTVYFNALGLRTFLRKDPKDIHIRFAQAPVKKMDRFDVPAYKLPLPETPPVGLSYNRWKEIEQKKQEHQNAAMALLMKRRAKAPKPPAQSEAAASSS